MNNLKPKFVKKDKYYEARLKFRDHHVDRDFEIRAGSKKELIEKIKKLK